LRNLVWSRARLKSSPITCIRSVICPVRKAPLSAGAASLTLFKYSARVDATQSPDLKIRRSRSGGVPGLSRTARRLIPQFPVITVVTPCVSLALICGRTIRAASSCAVHIDEARARPPSADGSRTTAAVSPCRLPIFAMRSHGWRGRPRRPVHRCHRRSVRCAARHRSQDGTLLLPFAACLKFRVGERYPCPTIHAKPTVHVIAFEHAGSKFRAKPGTSIGRIKPSTTSGTYGDQFAVIPRIECAHTFLYECISAD